MMKIKLSQWMGVMRRGRGRAALVPVVEGAWGLAFLVVVLLPPPIPTGIPARPRRCRLCLLVLAHGLQGSGPW